MANKAMTNTVPKGKNWVKERQRKVSHDMGFTMIGSSQQEETH